MPQGSPAERHEPIDAQVPVAAPPGRSQSPLQHSPSTEHISPTARQPRLAPQVQSPVPAQAIPAGLAQLPVQQSSAAVHGPPTALHEGGTGAHAPPEQKSVQQSSFTAQVLPSGMQPAGTHMRPSQLSEQQSAPTAQVQPMG